MYLVGAGFGELEVEDAIACSEAREPALRPITAAAVGDAILSSVKDPRVGTRAEWIRGEAARGEDPSGEADNVGALKGWTENELRRFAATALRVFLEI